MNVKNGFSSTLNRFWGKKNKGHQLSKSTTNLSLSSHIDTIPLSSHLEQNRITPLPAATSNAPFEQTFRITVLLPKGQLYVARLGAKTKLERLIELVCENKQLDPEKYEFRHPIDTSQVFSCELTIGAVGLSEIRLCHKSEAYDNFNADEIIKLRHTGRDSLSSSEFSSRNSKNTLKTASPYSSTNSLNSIDSTGMSTSYRGQILSLPPQTVLNRTTLGNHHPPVAPTRKKRVAPRPPSQNSIPEREIISTSGLKALHPEFNQPPKKDFHVSSPNLSQCTDLTTLRPIDFHQSNISIDCNGNNSSSRDNNSKSLGLDRPNGHISCNGQGANIVQKSNQKVRPVSLYDSEIIYNNNNNNINSVVSENDLGSPRSSNGSIKTFTRDGSTETVKMPEPVPRKRIITAAKKKAPAPPPRSFNPPVAPPRTTTITSSPEKETTEKKGVVEESITNGHVSHPSLNGVHSAGNYQTNAPVEVTPKSNEPQKPVKIEETTWSKANETNSRIISQPLDDTLHAINETGCNPVIEESPVEKVKLETNQSTESSSDEEEQLKVYNLKLGQTIVKPLTHQATMEDLSAISTISSETEEREVVGSISSRSTSPGWTYTIPAPENFADELVSYPDTNQEALPNPKTISENIQANDTIASDSLISTDHSSSPDLPITPIIKERPSVDFEVFTDTKVTMKDNESSETSENLITSDIEDGYRVGLDKLNPKSNGKDEKVEELICEKVIDAPVECKSKDESGLIIEDYGNTRNLSPLNSLESYDSNRSEVINELNNVLTEQRMETVIRKVEAIGEIDFKPCSLSNFKIQTYTQPNGPVRTSTEDGVEQLESTFNEEIERNHVKETISQLDGGVKQDSDTPRQCADDEKLYKKRSSMTLSNNTASQLFRSRASISRSDSFHSTRYLKISDIDEPLITSRSASFISLINAQKMDQRMNLNEKFIDTNRRKSSSELSIGESPSLQSLIVMKSILNSRNNSLNNESDTQTPKHINQTIYVSQKDNKTANSPEVETMSDCDSSKENSPKNKILSQQITSVERLEKRGEPEKKWTYQGPPSINVSTWSERPKIQVSIKDDSDYKFGGSSGGAGGGGKSNPVNTGNTSVVGNTLSSSTNKEKQSFRNSTTPEISNSNKIAHPMRIVKEQPKIPFVRSVEYKTSESPSKGESEIEINKFSNEINSPLFLKPLSVSTTMTLGRIPKINRTNIVPTVKGFKNIESVEDLTKTRTTNNEDNQNTLQFVNGWKNTSNGTQKDNCKESSTVLQVEKNILKLSNQSNLQGNKKHRSLDSSNEKEKQENISPFQVTLRKTGLKEKILSTDELRTTKPPTSHYNDQQSCTKLELKLTTLSPTVRMTNNSQQREHHLQSAPPPPPPPIIRSVVTKQNRGISPPSLSTTDPRDHLLSAIRNFKKDSLKRA